MARHLHLDPFAGVAGDMFIGAMIDLGAPLEALVEALEPLPIALPYKLTAKLTTRHSIRGIDFKVNIVDEPRFAPVAEHSHGASMMAHGAAEHLHVHPGEIYAMIDALRCADRVKNRARRTVKLLAEAEAKVHGISVEQVHFHEVGAVDSIVDMLGAAILLEELDVATVSCASLPIGQGFVKCAHGMMPLPAPATAELLKGMMHHGVERKGETVTPSGAAIVKAVTDTFGMMPQMEVEKVGYGAGDRDDKDVPNLLRAFIGPRK